MIKLTDDRLKKFIKCQTREIRKNHTSKHITKFKNIKANEKTQKLPERKSRSPQRS